MNLLLGKADLEKERHDSPNDLVVPLLAPLDGLLVHLVDHNYELLDAKRFCDQKMLSSLSPMIETSFILTFSCRNN